MLNALRRRLSTVSTLIRRSKITTNKERCAWCEEGEFVLAAGTVVCSGCGVEAATCLYCAHSNRCLEIRKIVSKEPERVLGHSCSKVSGISPLERKMRNQTLNDFGLAATAVAITSHKEVKVKMKTYTEKELNGMTKQRYTLRKIAETHGLSMTESSSEKSDELVRYILKEQKGSGGSNGKSSARAEAEGEEKEETPRSRSRKKEGDSLPDRTLLEALGVGLDALEKKQDIANAVFDRKLNIILASMTDIGKNVISEDYDALSGAEESFIKGRKYTVKLGAIQSESDLTDSEED